MSDNSSVPEQTPQDVDTPRNEGEDDGEPKPQGGGGALPAGPRETGGSNFSPGGHHSKPESIKHSPFGGKKEALESLRKVKEIEDPVERLKEYAHGKATEALLGLLEPPESAIVEIADAQKQAFQDIRAKAEEQSLREGILYLEDVLFEFEIADDMNVNHTGVIGKVERKTKKLKQHLDKKRERRKNPTTRSGSSETESESTPDRWRHLARAAIVLENCPNPDSFRDLKQGAANRCEQLNVRSRDGSLSEDPWGAIKKGVDRLREHLTGESHTPERYCEVDGFRNLVHDLVQGNDVSDSSSS